MSSRFRLTTDRQSAVPASRFASAAMALMLPFAAVSPAFAADEYVFDKGHTHILFAISHLGFSMTHGEFMEYEGTVMIDEGAIANSSVDVTIQMASVDTGHTKRDESLQKPDWLDTAQFPTMTFKSTAVEQTGDTTATMTGDLTLKGVTQPVTLDVALRGRGTNPFSNQEVLGFTASGTIKRSDFNFTHALPGIGDEIEITIETELNPAG